MTLPAVTDCRWTRRLRRLNIVIRYATEHDDKNDDDDDDDDEKR